VWKSISSATPKSGRASQLHMKAPAASAITKREYLVLESQRPISVIAVASMCHRWMLGLAKKLCPHRAVVSPVC